ncbi:DUF4871 domain-containing protein [Bacillus sp. FJAT-49711]|uniref:DUF4871 domain-containing protein n=1 Tax=Bacillus sp. FJAT-49711 TaxID=2833585 RepID=UPI001BC91C09|nr:DUF4871 domain-containing protein [Bacillus sp. FJAT-49711]MBS4220982.1 DUF4871 domain-containing protein [Bacillus sp. FJAT-49711]
MKKLSDSSIYDRSLQKLVFKMEYSEKRANVVLGKLNRELDKIDRRSKMNKLIMFTTSLAVVSMFFLLFIGQITGKLNIMNLSNPLGVQNSFEKLGSQASKRPLNKIEKKVEQGFNTGIGAPPVTIGQNIINNIDWTVSSTFPHDIYTIRGIQDKIGFIDSHYTSGVPNKYMWHFWDSIPRGDLSVVAINEKSLKISPALMHDDNYVWTTSHVGPNYTLPSNMKFNEPGKWALLIYIGDEYIDTIVVDVK